MRGSEETSEEEVKRWSSSRCSTGTPAPDAFEEYHANAHMPMVPKIPNLPRYEAARVVAVPDGSQGGGQLPYYRIFEAYFEGMERLQEGMSTPEGQAPPADLPNFATGGATIFISG